MCAPQSILLPKPTTRIGNITSGGGVNGDTRTYNSQNELTGITGGSAPTYDNNGNMTTDEVGNVYIYDAWNRLIVINDDEGHLIKWYMYDGLGRRIREGDGITDTKDFYYSPSGQVLFENRGYVSNVDAIYM